MSMNSYELKARKVKGIASVVFVGILTLVCFIAVLVPGNQIENPFDSTNPLDEMWVLFSAALVFFMQAGFLAYEVGLARPVHATVVAMKNVVDWTIASLGFFFIGFGLMFGSSASGFIGTDLFALTGANDVGTSVTTLTFFLFQVAFAGTAITLVSGSLVERTSLLAYTLLSIVIALVIYPVFGHWVWGNFLNPDNGAWLAEIGFHDFAGGSVVHLLGATIAFVGMKIIGPRIGRFGPDGEVNELAPSNVGLTMLGVLILWFGWWGFNGGSHLAFNGDVTATIVNTNLSGVAGLVGAGMWAYLMQERYAMNTKLVGGAIGGLIAITSSADIMSPFASIAVGLVAGVIYSLSHDFLLSIKVDDALGVVPAHGFCAIWGLLSLALFATDDQFEHGRFVQLGIQALGVAVCIAWAAGVSWIAYMAIQRWVGLRVAPTAELGGIDLEGGEGKDPLRRLQARIDERKALAAAASNKDRIDDEVTAS